MGDPAGGGGSSSNRGGLESSKSSAAGVATNRGGLESAKGRSAAKGGRGGISAVAEAVGLGPSRPSGPSLVETIKQIAAPVPPPSVSPEEVKRRLSLAAESRKRDRRATILTTGRGLDDQLGVVNRPAARTVQLLGG